MLPYCNNMVMLPYLYNMVSLPKSYYIFRNMVMKIYYHITKYSNFIFDYLPYCKNMVIFYENLKLLYY